MRKSYQYIDIDINKKTYKKLRAIQYDSKSRYILVNLYDNYKSYDLLNCSVKVFGLKSDKKIFFNYATITDAAKGIFEIELTNQALAAKGELEIQILILGINQERLTSFSFYIDVEKSIIDDNAIESTNEFTALTIAIDQTNKWNSYFEETSGQIEQKYTERLNELRDNRSIFYSKNNEYVAHRGTSLYPENTILAITKSYEMGYKWIETDVAITSDGVFVLCHDAVVDRIFGGAKTGTLKNLTYDEIKDYDIKVGDCTDYPNEKIATFEDCLKTCKKLNLSVFIHVEYIDTNEVKKLVDLIVAYGMSDKATLNSYKFNLMQEVRKYNTEIPVTVFGGYSEESITKVKSLKNSFMDVAYEHADSKTKVDTYHNAGMKVVVSTINDYAKAKQLFENGVDLILTDVLIGGEY